MRRKLEDLDDDAKPVATKKQKVDPAFCKSGCGRICNPGTTNKGNLFDTCCKPCAVVKNQDQTVYHDFACNQRIYSSVANLHAFVYSACHVTLAHHICTNRTYIHTYKEHKVQSGEIEPVDNWHGVNNRIAKKVQQHIGGVIRDCLPAEFTQGIHGIVMEFITPRLIPRPYWTPETDEQKNTPITASKYGGKPLLTKNEEWPKCASCSNYMPLFVQLNVNDLPEEFRQKYTPKNKHGDGLWKDHVIQLFYCANVDVCDDGYEAFHGQHCQRAIPLMENRAEYKDDAYLDEIAKIIEQKAESEELDWQNIEAVITEWTKHEGVEAATYEIADELTEIFGTTLDLGDEHFGMGVTAFVEDNYLCENDKLFGYPAFINDYEYPACNEAGCSEKLRGMVFQTDAQVLEFCWSDVGVGQILYCPQHPLHFGFTWQSS